MNEVYRAMKTLNFVGSDQVWQIYFDFIPYFYKLAEKLYLKVNCKKTPFVKKLYCHRMSALNIIKFLQKKNSTLFKATVSSQGNGLSFNLRNEWEVIGIRLLNEMS